MNECFFSGFMGNESECRTNKWPENRFAVHTICLSRAPTHSPLAPRTALQLIPFVCPTLWFIPHEPRKQEAQKATVAPHIVHLSTMCHLFDRSARAVIFIYSDWKTQLGRRCWDLASCQISLNSVQRFQRRSRKCLSQSEARAAILFFRSARKTQTW